MYKIRGYDCQDCQARFELLIAEEEVPNCAVCGSKDVLNTLQYGGFKIHGAQVHDGQVRKTELGKPGKWDRRNKEVR
jgi:DNA-directed RNA polymerase subunit RPC12/RpoP